MQLTSLSLAAAGALAREEAGQRQAERGEGAGVEEVAAGQAVAERDGTRGVQAQHGGGLREGQAEGGSMK